MDPELLAFARYDYTRLVAALALMCGSRAVAEDATQEALARAWERMDRGQRIDSPAAWITVVASNLVRSAVRRRHAERRALARIRRERPATTELAMPEVAVDVARAIGGLAWRQREAVVLHYWLEMTVAEIAAALGVSEGTVKSALHRARRHLHAALTEDEVVT
jgi:RNA polymerase sigma-70 factor, ECF subfamily